MIGFEEPEPTEEFEAEEPWGRWIALISVNCVIEARKVDGGDGTSV